MDGTEAKAEAMIVGVRVHQYLVFDTQALARSLPTVVTPLERVVGKEPSSDRFDPEAIQRFIIELTARYGHELHAGNFTVDDVPFVDLIVSDRKPKFRASIASKTVVALSSPSDDDALSLRRAALAAIQGDASKTLLGIGVNPLVGAAQYAPPTASNGALFGTSADAWRLTHFDQLKGKLTGANVTVVVVDTGFDKAAVPAGKFRDGLLVLPSTPPPYRPAPPGMTTGEPSMHATMIVNTIRSFAPDAYFFDVPVIPPLKINDLPTFLHVIEAAYQSIIDHIVASRKQGTIDGPWVLINAWGVYDRQSESPFIGEYTENRGGPPDGVHPHPFISAIETLAANGIDMVFAAGNCGEVSPDCRCGGNDYGPNRSIWGANAHRDVVTAGAVRVDGAWLGFSSEGEGPTPNLEQHKPDLCAPSQFVDLNGGYPPTDGTSGAAAVVAGIVAALRSHPAWDQISVPPQALRGALMATAKQPYGAGWNRWFGHGIVDAAAAHLAVEARTT